jgi:hypothetical protein
VNERASDDYNDRNAKWHINLGVRTSTSDRWTTYNAVLDSPPPMVLALQKRGWERVGGRDRGWVVTESEKPRNVSDVGGGETGLCRPTQHTQTHIRTQTDMNALRGKHVSINSKNALANGGVVETAASNGVPEQQEFVETTTHGHTVSGTRA